ncbi:unnamed protein product [Cuscuta campestris]|uniref:Microspherule protein N-terminal domain-containing protein n=1 Tax=Cuscuta campestris TaxID=132261 RepID=A0A484KTP6_9ASTE|nr:unnamed protein product [Cuscuta campestris]
MGALPPPPHWLPRDDFLLKNAAEAGASLESLARGAVKFSRRFTVQELQERWISLLYDPVVSEQASAKMLEFECLCAFSSNHHNDSCFDNENKDFKSVCGKRQTRSVKRCYYSMRKRIRNEAFLPSIDVDFLTGFSGNNNNNDNGDDCNPPPLPPDSSFFGDSLTDQFGFIDNSVFPNNEHNLPENISGTEFEVPLLNSPFGYSPSSEMPPDWNDFTLPVDDDIIIQSEPPKMEDQMGISTPSTDDLLAQIDSILNSTSDDDMFPIDNIENESYLDTYGSLLLDSPNGGRETEKEENVILPNEPLVQKAQLHYYGGDQVLLSSALSVNPACPELRNGVICCTLNTEDPDIPSNDDVFLPIRIPSTPLPSAVLCKYDEAYRPTLKCASDVQMNNRWSFMKIREKSDMGVPNIDTVGDVVTRNTSSNEGLDVMTSSRIATTTTTLATRTTICALPAVATTKNKTLVGCSMDTPQKQELCSHDPISNTSMLDQEDLC